MGGGKEGREKREREKESEKERARERRREGWGERGKQRVSISQCEGDVDKVVLDQVVTQRDQGLIPSLFNNL